MTKIIRAALSRETHRGSLTSPIRERYTRAADQARLARNAMERVGTARKGAACARIV
jgi:hypothetical protein